MLDWGFFGSDKVGNFESMFGAFRPIGVSDEEFKPNEVTLLNDGRANPCRDCGKFPSLHNVSFRKIENMEKHFYIVCENCSECDGRWYATADEAIEAWNKANPSSVVAVDKVLEHAHDMVADIMKDFKAAA